jgi:mono/diheme cytochrome c family protein
VLIARENWSMGLLIAMQNRQVAPGDLDVPRRQRLAKHSSARVRALAQKVLASTETNRQDVVDANRSVLSLTGDRTRGGKVFATQCASCHRVENVGNEIGPGLASVAS